MADHPFTENGAFKINDQYATGIRYNVTLNNSFFSEGTVRFMNGRKEIAAVQLENRVQAIEILGERNVENIEAGKGQEKGKEKQAKSSPSIVQGKLQSENLAYQESKTPDYLPENTIEAGMDRQVGELDEEVRAWVNKRREQMASARPEHLQPGKTEGIDAAASGKPGRKPSQKAQPDKALNDTQGISQNAIPASVKNKFIQANNKFYFPDKTPAFDDRGTKLATRSDHQEVIRSLISIAQARGWTSVTVRGSEAFKRASWLEAAQSGIEVSGYKPTPVEKAHLAKLLDGRDPENSIERGIQPEQLLVQKQSGSRLNKTAGKPAQTNKNKTVEQTAETNQEPSDSASPGAATSAKNNPIPLRDGFISGKLLEHGHAKYQNNPKKEDSYFVTVETEKGEQTLWGVDLKRAIAESAVKVGENIAIEKQDRQPVTVPEKVFNEQGQVIGQQEINTHRNKWFIGSLDKAQAFTNGERDKVVKQHPELSSAYGTMAAARKFAEKQFPSKTDQARFVEIAQQVMAEKIAHGEPVIAPRIRETRSQEKLRKKDNEHEQVR